MFDQYTPEKSLTLVRNPHWDPNTDPGRTAYPDKYVFDLQTANSKIDQILLNDKGDGQTTLTYDDVLSENFRTFQNEHGDRLVLGGQPCTQYWGLDYRKITDKNVRMAVGYAFPYRDAILASGAIEDVTRIPGNVLLPPGIPGRQEYQVLDTAAGETDPAKAKALLEEAGEVGYEIRFPFANDDPNEVKLKDVVVSALKEAGFTPKPVATTIADFSTLRANPDANINVRPAGWCSDWPSGSSWFPPVLGSTNLEEEGLGANYSAFSEKEVDDRIDEILASPIEEQPDAWAELDKYIAEEYYPMVVRGYYGLAMAHGSAVNGHNVDNTLGMPTWKNVWVSQ
jgi:peptide/nickel transport system substrate-binding protein